MGDEYLFVCNGTNVYEWCKQRILLFRVKCVKIFRNCCLDGFVRFLTFVFDSSKFESSVNGIYEITAVAGGFAKQQSSSTRYVG